MDFVFDEPAVSDEDRPTRTILVGVDPGMSGAICVIYRNTVIVVDVKKLPDNSVNVVRLAADYTAALRRVIETYNISRDYVRINTTIEDVHAIGGAGAGSTFTFGRALGAIEAVAMFVPVSMSLPYTLERVQPRAWKKAVGLIGSAKCESVDVAQNLMPGVKFRRHDQSDACVIALWPAVKTTPTH